MSGTTARMLLDQTGGRARWCIALALLVVSGCEGAILEPASSETPAPAEPGPAEQAPDRSAPASSAAPEPEPEPVLPERARSELPLVPIEVPEQVQLPPIGHLSGPSELVPGAIAALSPFETSPVPDFYQEPGTAAGRALDVNPEGGEVVDPYSGILELRYVDAKLIGAGLPIEIVRTYRPNRTPPGFLDTDYLGRRNAIGVGWDLHFGRVYQPRLRGCRPARVFADANPVVELADGTRKVFFLADANAAGALPYDYITQDRWVARCNPAASGGLIVYDPNGLIYTFATLGAVSSGDPFDTWSLTSVKDRNNNTLTFQYVTIGGLLLPAGVVASDGRQVTLSYTTLPSGQALLAAVATPTGSTTFNHTLASAGTDHYKLTRVIGPADAGAPTFEYGYYSDAPEPGYNPHALRSMRNPFGGVTSYQYASVSLASDPIFQNSMVISQKQRSDGTQWTYRFGLRLTGSELDYTEIITPTTNEVYTHCGYRGLKLATAQCQLKDGLLQAKEVYARSAGGVIVAGNKTGTLVHRETLTWGHVLVANQSEYRPGSTGLTLPAGAYEDRLLMTVTERGGERFTQIRSNFDAYSNVGLLTEYHGPVVLSYGQDPPSDELTTRQKVYTYWTSTTLPRWILHEVASESLIDGCDSIRFPTWSSIPSTFLGHGYIGFGTGATAIAPECQRRLNLGLPAGGTERSFDALGNVEWTRTIGRTDQTTYTRNADGTIATTTDPLLRVTRYESYYRGVPRREVKEEGVVITRVVDAAGNVTSETRPGPNAPTVLTSPRWSFAYDGLNRVKRVTTPKGQTITTTFSYPAPSCVGCVATRTLARGDFRRVESFDAFGRQVKIVLSSALNPALSITSETEYDLIGRKSVVWGPGAKNVDGTRYAYDALDRVTSVTHVVGGVNESSASFVFNRGGLEVVMTDERGKVMVTSYDAYGSPEDKLLSQVEQRAVPANRSVITRHYHTRFGKTVEVAQSGFDGTTPVSASRLYIPDERGRVVLIQEPEYGLRGNIYDDAGNLTQTWAATNSRVTMTYDRLNRRTRTDYPNSTQDVELSYWPNGSIRTARTLRGTTPVVSTDYAYDLNGNLLSEATTHDGRVFRTSYTYSFGDALATLTYPDGLVVNYAPDVFGRPTRAGTFATSVSYYPSGQVRDVVYGNGKTMTMTRNGRGQTQRVSVPGVVDLAYSFDAAGNPTRIDDGIDPAASRTMGYDDLGRLITADGPWGLGTFSYNGLGSMTAMTLGGETTTYAHATSGRLGVRLSRVSTTIGGTTTILTPSYDTYGNALSSARADLVHDDGGRLTRATLRSSPTTFALYTYDALGRRIARQTSATGEPTFTITSQSGRLHHQLAGGNRRDYIWLGALLIAQRDDDCVVGRDLDADGISDCAEVQAQLNPNLASDALLDADGDGLDNRGELAAGTHLNRPDTDGDGNPDGAEVRVGSNPLVVDTLSDLDGDGLNTTQEIAAGTRADRADTDGDGLNDKYEFDNGLNPLSATDRDLDLDGDGWSNYLEAVAGSLANSADYFPAPGRLRVELPLASMAGDAPSGLLITPSGNLIVETRELVSSAIRVLLSAYTPSGTRLWQFNPGSFGYNAPIVGPDNTVYVFTSASSTPELMAISSSGALRWRRPVSLITNVGSLNSRPRPFALGPDGMLYLTADDGGVRGLHVIDPASNTVLRRTPLNGVPEGVVVAANGTAYVGGEKISAISPAGALLWQINAPTRGPKPDGSALTADETRARVAALGGDGTIYVVHETLYPGDRQLIALQSSGVARWSVSVSEEIDNVLVGPGELIYVLANTKLWSFRADGTSRWAATPCAGYPASSTSGNWGKAAPALSADGTLWMGCSTAVISVRAADGLSKYPAYSGFDTPGTANLANSAPAIAPNGDVFVLRGRALHFTYGTIWGLEGYPAAGVAPGWSMADGSAQRAGRVQP